MAADRLSIRLSPKLRRRLQRLSRRLQRKESELVREVLESFCASDGREPTCYDLALRAGFIGSAKNTPADLSTNPKHMEGFGKL
jgi:hypothetical protein